MLICKNLSAPAFWNLKSSRLGRNINLQRKGPLVAIANYVFDSLPQDAFAIDNGGIHELLVTTSAAADDEIPYSERLAIFLPELRHPPQHYADDYGTVSWSNTAPGFLLPRSFFPPVRFRRYSNSALPVTAECWCLQPTKDLPTKRTLRWLPANPRWTSMLADDVFPSS